MQALRERRPHRAHNSPASGFKHDQTLHGSSLKHSHLLPSVHRRCTYPYLCIALQFGLNVILIASVITKKSGRQTSSNEPLLLPGSKATTSTFTSYDWFVTIYAYDRPKHLLNLLHDIAREADAAHLNVGVNVIDDNSYGCQFRPVSRNIYQSDIDKSSTKANNSDDNILVLVPLPETLPCSASHRFKYVERFLYQRGWKLYVSKYRHGRRRYWHLVRQAHVLLQPVDSKFFLFLPDDDRLSHNFFPTISNLWQGISDPRKLTLMLHVEETREHTAVWTNVIPRHVGNNVSRIGWVESGNFVCTRDLLTFLNWSFPAISPRRWLDNPPISSGVGATLSQLIHSKHWRMYRTDQSLVAHVGVTLSKMNAEFRDANTPALVTKYFVDGDAAYTALLAEATTVTASIASFWVRQASLHAAVHSLASQVDRINVYLNGYEEVPSFLNAPYICTVLHDADFAAGDIGDIGKFFWANNLTTEFHLTADDDIEYPADYVERLLAFRNTFQPPVVVGVHGIRLKHELLRPHPTHRRSLGYYASREVWMASEAVSESVNVHIIGTGTMLYKPSEIGTISLQHDFKKPNMADIWFGLLAQRLEMPMMIVPHSSDWISEIPGTYDDSIYKRSTKRRTADRDQTEAALSIPEWRLYPPRFRHPR